MTSGDEFEVALSAPAQRAIRRLPEKAGTAIVEFIFGSLAQNPHRVGKPLRLELAGLHCARRGTYRVIYRIDDTRHRVEITAIEHRSDAYRPHG